MLIKLHLHIQGYDFGWIEINEIILRMNSIN